MTVPYLLRQVAHPEGALSRLVARSMNVGNARLNAMAIAALPDRAGQNILDIGFGGGISSFFGGPRGEATTSVQADAMRRFSFMAFSPKCRRRPRHAGLRRGA